MAYFPFMTEVSDKDILVVGGGRSAFHKVRAFCGFGAHLTVIAENISPDIIKVSGEFAMVRKPFEITDLEGRDIVIASTDDRELNRRIVDLARERGIPANAVDDKEHSDFIFPAVLKKENYSVSVCTDGRSPLLAGRIRSRIAELIPEEFDEAVGELGRMREDVLKTTDSQDERARLFREEADKRIGIRKIRIGTRSSALAMAQTEIVIRTLKEQGINCEAVIIRTEGDKQTDRPLWEFGGKAVFVSEFEEAILSGRIDIAIHSAKDMPGELPQGIDILACLEREEPCDVLVSLSGRRPEDIRIVGTSSRRRQALIEELSSNYITRPLRGNVPTRLTKLRRGEFDALVLAKAGLKRLGLDDEPDLRYVDLDPERFIPAAGQGIIAIEGLAVSDISDAVRSLDDREASAALRAERGFMKAIGADCHASVGAWATVQKDGRMLLRVMKHDGGNTARVCAEGKADNIESIVAEAVSKMPEVPGE